MSRDRRVPNIGFMNNRTIGSMFVRNNKQTTLLSFHLDLRALKLEGDGSSSSRTAYAIPSHLMFPPRGGNWGSSVDPPQFLECEIFNAQTRNQILGQECVRSLPASTPTATSNKSSQNSQVLERSNHLAVHFDYLERRHRRLDPSSFRNMEPF